MAPQLKEATRRAILAAYNKRCVYCNEFLALKDLEIDHIIPQTLEKDAEQLKKFLKSVGLDENFDLRGLENLAPAHHHCNNKKRDHKFAESSINFRVEMARRNLERVITFQQRFIHEEETGKGLSIIKSMIENGVLQPHMIEPLLTEHRGQTYFRLLHELVFADGTTFKEISRANVEQILTLPIKHGHPDEFWLDLTNGNEDIRITNALEWVNARKKGFYGGTTYAMKMEAWYDTAASIAKAVELAKPPTVSYISAQSISICSLQYLPANVLLTFSPEEDEYMQEAEALGKSVLDVINEGEAQIRMISPHSVSLEYNGGGTFLREIMRADFNNDGIEDILLEQYIYATEGTFGSPSCLMAFRPNETSLFQFYTNPLYEEFPSA